jgi:hypothetical protein
MSGKRHDRTLNVVIHVVIVAVILAALFMLVVVFTAA